MKLFALHRYDGWWIGAGLAILLLVLFAGPYVRSRPGSPLREALPHLDGVIDRSRNTPDTLKSGLYVRASRALKDGDARAAESIYREIIANYPKDSDGYDSLATCLYFQNRWDEAMREYSLALELNPKSAHALYGLGSVAYIQGRQSEARGYLERALALEPDNALGHRLLGFVSEQLGMVPEAIEHFERARALDPSMAADAGIKHRLEELKR